MTASLNSVFPLESRVSVLVKEGCHLCEDALAVVSKACLAANVSWEVSDITADAQALLEYGDYVPVLFVDGVQQGFWRIDEDRLSRLLK